MLGTRVRARHFRPGKLPGFRKVRFMLVQGRGGRLLEMLASAGPMIRRAVVDWGGLSLEDFSRDPEAGMAFLREAAHG